MRIARREAIGRREGLGEEREMRRETGRETWQETRKDGKMAERMKEVVTGKCAKLA